MQNVKYTFIKKYLKYSILAFTSLGLVAITWAAFSDKGKVSGSSFNVGSADMKLVDSLSGGIEPNNLKDEKPGPSFSNLVPNWTQNYPIKLYNNGTSPMAVMSNSNYTTANDPDDLRSYIFVEPFAWEDVNNNGEIESGEQGQSFGKKSIVKWKTEGYDFGTVNNGEIMGLILKFSVDSLSDTKQGKSALYDFEFSAIQN